jgi:hypothetical protein
VVVLTLNPAGLLQESRDSNRISDMAALNSAIGYSLADNSGESIGSPNTVYVSIPDPVATSTAGDQCQGLGLLSLPLGYSYHCAASSTFRQTNGTGWIPVNLSGNSFGSSLAQLPIDPVNASSSHLYYTYETNGSQFEVTSAMESGKYNLGGSNDVVSTDGGSNAYLLEKGTNLTLAPIDYGTPSGLVGYWPLDEGTGTVAYDWSGNNASGSWGGGQIGTNGYYSTNAKLGNYTGDFDGSSTYVNSATSGIVQLGNNSLSVFAWIYPTNTSSTSYYGGFIYLYGKDGQTANSDAAIGLNASGILALSNDVAGTSWYLTSFTPSLNTWHFVGYTYQQGATNATVYFDGQSSTKGFYPNLGNTSWVNYSAIGRDYPYQGYFPGLIEDVRVYDVALSASQVAALYAGGQ